MVNSKVPKLRFKEFSDEWEEKKLGEVGEGFDYGISAASKKYDGKYSYLRITDIDDESHKFNKDNLTSPDEDNIEELVKYQVKENDILLARTGASTGKSYLYNEEDGDVYFAGFLIRVNIPKANSNFVFQQTLSKKYQKWVKVISVRTGQPGINAEEYKSFKFYIPSLPEQTKIGDFLSLIDKKIELEEKALTKLNELKKGYMQKIFNQEIRFKDENGNDYLEWKEKKLGDILIEICDKTTCNNQYAVLSSTNSGLYKQQEYFNNQVASKNNIGYKILKKNQIVISPQNLWLGNINFNSKYDIGIVSPSYKVFNINNNYNKFFINYLLKTSYAFYMYKNVSEQGASIVRRNLNIDLFNDLKFNIPSLPEQTKIANFLSKQDELIEKQERKIALLKEQKKGLLQQMFV